MPGCRVSKAGTLTYRRAFSTFSTTLETAPTEARVKATFSGLILVLALSGPAAAPAAAHHGAASFDTTMEVTLKGTVTEWTWFNPHCFLKFDVKAEDGTVKSWAVEAGNPTDMTKRGWSRNSFKKGDEVSVTLQPVKTGAPVGRIRSVMLADGREFK
jgi:hypothetical protein